MKQYYFVKSTISFMSFHVQMPPFGSNFLRQNVFRMVCQIVMKHVCYGQGRERILSRSCRIFSKTDTLQRKIERARERGRFPMIDRFHLGTLAGMLVVQTSLPSMRIFRLKEMGKNVPQMPTKKSLGVRQATTLRSLS